jgi:hypothetical protein
MEFSYNTIKELAKESGRKVTDLIALAAQNDPFYTGTPGEVVLAEWFADFYHSSYAPGTKVHVRRCHYKILSLSMHLPNGLPYENTEQCWNTLLMATKAARYLRMVDVDMFEDRKNDAPADYSQTDQSEPALNVYSGLYTSDIELPDFPNLPEYSIDNYQGEQRYHMEIWAEKTTMNDILLPLCQRYGMVLQTGAGELSITATKALADRIAQSGKPARILYISDYDPGGLSMPVAVARKLEYFVRTEQLDVDVRLFPAVLTAAQVKRYSLPRTPIKDTERRKEAFEARHGAGATELDALEALRPGELQRILRGYIESYYDTSLERRARERRAELERDLQAIRRQVLEDYSDQLDQARQELEGIRADLGPRMAAYSEHIQQIWRDIMADLREQSPDLANYPLPEARDATEIGSGLYNSERDYLRQIDAYKNFQGK